jgi:hypothetical protein
MLQLTTFFKHTFCSEKLKATLDLLLAALEWKNFCSFSS